MKILIVHGSPRKNGFSSTVALSLAKKLVERNQNSEINNIYLIDDNIPYCKGCFTCVEKGIEKCPQSEIVLSYRDKLVESDVIILASPVYISHASGLMKVFSDHFASIACAHRPEPSMFKKIGVVISTATGAGNKSTIKDLEDITLSWGIPVTYKLSYFAKTRLWEDRSEKLDNKIVKDIEKISNKIEHTTNKKRIFLKPKIWFSYKISLLFVKKFSNVKLDYDYWKNNGWFNGEKPWKI